VWYSPIDGNPVSVSQRPNPSDCLSFHSQTLLLAQSD
jgi:hypothetical protein